MPCFCTSTHQPRTLVLTGGPGAGKTAVLELIQRSFCEHVVVLPEAASIVYNGGFPRRPDVVGTQAVQRAIYHVQRELEASARIGNPALVLCDRGTVDGMAYWSGDEDLYVSVGTTAEREFGRYDAVIHVHTPDDGLYRQAPPLRPEVAPVARALDRRILDAWHGHPRRFVVESHNDFLVKVRQTVALVHAELPPCCRSALSDF